jgi:hypothetical protein
VLEAAAGAKTQEVLVLVEQVVVVRGVLEEATQLLELPTQAAVVVGHIQATQEQAAQASSSSECPTTSVQPSLVA